MRSASHGMEDPTGVAVDDVNNIYITDYGSNSVIKLNKDLILNKMCHSGVYL